MALDEGDGQYAASPGADLDAGRGGSGGSTAAPSPSSPNVSPPIGTGGMVPYPPVAGAGGVEWQIAPTQIVEDTWRPPPTPPPTEIGVDTWRPPPTQPPEIGVDTWRPEAGYIDQSNDCTCTMRGAWDAALPQDRGASYQTSLSCFCANHGGCSDFATTLQRVCAGADGWLAVLDVYDCNLTVLKYGSDSTEVRRDVFDSSTTALITARIDSTAGYLCGGLANAKIVTGGDYDTLSWCGLATERRACPGVEAGVGIGAE
jgi:hypothetical protein